MCPLADNALDFALAGARRAPGARLEAAGFQVMRAAASKGPADLVAWNATSIRPISVKSGTKYASLVKREVLTRLVRPANASVEIWRFPDSVVRR